jgi:hypothetical protein
LSYRAATGNWPARASKPSSHCHLTHALCHALSDAETRSVRGGSGVSSGRVPLSGTAGIQLRLFDKFSARDARSKFFTGPGKPPNPDANKEH